MSSSSESWFLPHLASSAVRLFLLAYDALTLPVTLLVYRPWRRRAVGDKVRARVVEEGEGYVTVEAYPRECQTRDEIFGVGGSPPSTLNDLWTLAVLRGGDRDCLGTRECFARETERDPKTGREMVKLVQGEYRWMSYREADERAADFARGMVGTEVGAEPGEKVAIYADSRAEWMLAAAASFKSSLALVTLYTNLSEGDVVYALRQTKVEKVITSQDLIEKLFRVLEEVPSVRTVVYFESRVGGGGKRPTLPPGSSVRVLPFMEVEAAGRMARGEVELTPPSSSSLAILMYTSGSTGAPKGALLSHGSLAESVAACIVGASDLLPLRRTGEEAYVAYLPMAHIFELTHELIVMLMGIRVGYSSPYTLTDAGTMVKKGQLGDSSLLKPTVMIAVPLILERLHSAIRAKIRSRGPVFESVFDALYRYRLWWTRRGCDTPVINRVLFSKFRMALGGRVGLMVGGGAPLAAEVHDFLRTCLCCTVAQGYGLTETAGGVSLADGADLSTGRVGHPLQGVRARLVDWEEGGYRAKEGRGELVIGCPWLAEGYYEMKEKTEESFYQEGKQRWFRTGDIAELMPNGTLRIVDRRKDLVKLQLGEYVSLGKVESALRLLDLAESVCACADPTKLNAVALLVPKEEAIRALDRQITDNNNEASEQGNIKPLDKICSYPKIVDAVLDQIRLQCQKSGLNKYETPAAVTLLPEAPWTPDSGLVTAAMKLRRRQIQNRYQAEIDRMYRDMEKNLAPR